MHVFPVNFPFARLTVLAAGLFSACVGAQSPAAPASSPAQALGFSTVAQALSALQARDGNGTVVTQADGWVVINEPMATAQWSFTPPGHEAYPAVVRRTIQREPGGVVKVNNVQLCEASAEACGRLQVEFESMNERIRQAVKARERTPPPQPPQ